MYDSTRWFSGIGMSWPPISRSDWTASFRPGAAGGVPSVADIASSSSIDAGSYFFSVKPSPSASALHFVGADAVDQPVEMLADARLGPGAVRRFEQHVDGAVESCFAASTWPCSSSFWPALNERSEAAMRARTGSSTGAGAGAGRLDAAHD